jgi:hypothetical protein
LGVRVIIRPQDEDEPIVWDGTNGIGVEGGPGEGEIGIEGGAGLPNIAGWCKLEDGTALGLLEVQTERNTVQF